MEAAQPSLEQLAAAFPPEEYLAGRSLPYDKIERHRQHMTGLLVRCSKADLVEVVKRFPGLCAPILIVTLLELIDDARFATTKFDVFLTDFCMHLGFGGAPDSRLVKLRHEGKLFARVCNTVWGKTCGLSSASSLCVDCFKAGDHEGHDYCIYKSSFGGCCDCGNPEAWATSGGHDATENPLEVLEGDPFLGEGKAFAVMLHTVFLLTLRSILTEAMAVGLEEEVEPWDGLLKRFARHSVPWLEKLSGVGDSIRRQAGRELLHVWLSGDLPPIERPERPEEDERLAVAIDRYRAANARADERKAAAPKRFSLLHGLGACYSTSMCDQLINLYLQLLYDTEFKYGFMSVFLHHYPSLADHMLTLSDDRTKREMDDFINRVTAQLWNIHDSIEELSKGDMDLVGLLMDTLFSILVRAVPEGKLHVSCASPVTKSDLYWSFATDMTTVLSYDPVFEHVMRERKDLLQTWLEIMALCVDVTPIKRERFAHVQYEQDEWRVSFALEISLSRSFQPFFSGFSKLISNLGVEHGNGSGQQLMAIRDRVGAVVHQLNDMFMSLNMKQDLVSKVLDGSELLMTEYNIQLRPVTMHISLHRILAGFILQAIDVADLETIISKESLPPNFLQFLLEHPLRIHALHGQVQAGMWVRNGNSLLSQVVLYRKNQCCYDDGFDYDVALMQITCILLGADEFVAVAKDRFGFTRTMDEELADMATKDRTTLMFEFLAFLIHISSHLFRSSLSDEDQIVRELVHRLVWEDQTFSKVSSTICQRLTQNPKFEELLNKVATHQGANDFEEGRYKLRPDYWELFDQYYPRFLPRERQLAQDRYRSFLAGANLLKEKGGIPRPRISPIKPHLARITQLLTCRSMLAVVRSVLKQRVRHESLAENVVHAVLHLLYLGLEQAPAEAEAQDAIDYDARLRADNGVAGESILELLVTLYGSSDETVQPFIRYLLVKASQRSQISNTLVVRLMPELAAGAGAAEDKNELRRSQLRERNRRRQQEIMDKFKAAQSNFLRTTSDDVLQCEADEDESAHVLTCVLCRDSVGVDQLHSSRRVIGLMGLVQRSRLLAVAESLEAPDAQRPDLLTVSINKSSSEKGPEPMEEDPPEPSDDARAQEVPRNSTIASPRRACDGEDACMSSDGEEDCAAAEALPRLDTLLPEPGLEETKDVRFCGHHVHSDCLFRYFATLCAKHEARQDFEGRRIVALPHGEFLCPFCRRLCNCLVPAVGRFPNKYTAAAMADEAVLQSPPPPPSVSDWLQCLSVKVVPCTAQVAALDLGSPAPPFPQGWVAASPSRSAPAGSGGGVVEPVPAAVLVPPSSPVPPPADHAVGAVPLDGLRQSLEMLIVRCATVQTPLYPIQAMERLDGPLELHHIWEVVVARLVALEQRARHSDEPFFYYLERHGAETSQSVLLLSAAERYQELSPRAADAAAQGHERLLEMVLGRGVADGLLEKNLFSVLAFVVCSGQAVVSDVHFCGLVRILAAAHLLQIIASLMAESAGVAPQPPAALVVLRRLAAGEQLTHQPRTGGPVPLCDVVRERMAPFLRQAAALYTAVAAQAGVTDPLDAVTMADTVDDHQALCAFLQLPRDPVQLMSDDVLQLAHSWAGAGSSLRRIHAPVPFSFTPLPHLFQEAYQHLATQVCTVCNDVTVEPGICLLCGAFVCGGTKHLDIPLSHLKHSETCCSGIGVFLMLKLCTVLLLRGKRISVWNSIYLDEHGEEDLELRRGKALFLNESRLRQLLTLVLSQAVDHDTRVLDKTKQLVRA